MKKKHLISLSDYSPENIQEIINLSLDIKYCPGKYQHVLEGNSIALLFQKPSLRTKTAFHLGAQQLGAKAIYYGPEEVKLGQREAVKDVAKNLSCYFDGIVLRTFSHEIIEEFVEFSQSSVINGLSDLFHPSQALADCMTIIEHFKELKQVKVVFIGDANNVCHSLLYAFSLLGGHIEIATPQGYDLLPKVVEECKAIAQKTSAVVKISHDIEDVISQAKVIYTDVWVSMGKESEREKRIKDFANFQINKQLVKQAAKDYIFMHCLPAHRGEEVTDEIIDDQAHSVVIQQAENRLYTAQAILLSLIGGK